MSNITIDEIINYIFSIRDRRYLSFLHQDSIFPTMDLPSDNHITLYTRGTPDTPRAPGTPGSIRVEPNMLQLLNLTHHGYFSTEQEIRQLVTLLFEKKYTTLDLVTTWEILNRRNVDQREIYSTITQLFDQRMRTTLSAPNSLFQNLYVHTLRGELATIVSS